MKICHVIGSLGAGGIERWLLSIFRLARESGVRWDIDLLVLFDGDMALRRDFEAIGVKVSLLDFRWSRYLSANRELSRYFRRRKFDVVHSHLDFLSGFVLPIAARSNVPKRISHVHNTRFSFSHEAPLGRKLLGYYLKSRTRRSATLELGCSEGALEAFYGRGASGRVHHCSIPLPTVQPTRSERLRARFDLGLPASASVLISLGRLSSQKNTQFTLRVFAELLKSKSDSILLIAGCGPEREALRGLVDELGLGDAVRFLGVRDDVPRLLYASDLLIQPSIYEGLPVSVLEAQAFGVRCVISDNITAETVIVPNLVKRLPLDMSPGEWALNIRQFLISEGVSFELASSLVRDSSFALPNGLKDLLQIYDSQ